MRITYASVANGFRLLFFAGVFLLGLAYMDLQATKPREVSVPVAVIVPVPVFVQPAEAWSDVTLMPDESWTYSLRVNGIVARQVHVYNNSYEMLKFNPTDLIVDLDCPAFGQMVYGNMASTVYFGTNSARVVGDNWEDMLQSWDWQCGNALYAPAGTTYYHTNG